MSRALIVRRAGPGVTVQDLGRPGFMAYGLSRGGAADRRAMAEGAALLGQKRDLAAIEMAGFGGEFEVTGDIRVALTGAPMRATLDGADIRWNTSHILPAGSILNIGGATAGVYGYLHVAGGVETPERIGSRSAHLAARLGGSIDDGARLPVGQDPSQNVGLTLDVEPRFSGGEVRIVPSLQTEVFAPAERERFTETIFTRDTRGNRMGVRLLPDGCGFATDAGLNILSEVIVPGDIQITGDGTPYVLMTESQTTGGYPRIGSVIPADLPRVAQAAPGTQLTFRFITLDEAVEIERKERAGIAELPRRVYPLIRDPHDIADLLAYQLVGGVTAGDDLEPEGT